MRPLLHFIRGTHMIGRASLYCATAGPLPDPTLRNWRLPRLHYSVPQASLCLPMRTTSRESVFPCCKGLVSVTTPMAPVPVPQAPVCSSTCDKPNCAWKCRKPDACPRPKCDMVCEAAPGCPGSTGPGGKGGTAFIADGQSSRQTDDSADQPQQQQDQQQQEQQPEKPRRRGKRGGKRRRGKLWKAAQQADDGDAAQESMRPSQVAASPADASSSSPSFAQTSMAEEAVADEAVHPAAPSRSGDSLVDAKADLDAALHSRGVEATSAAEAAAAAGTPKFQAIMGELQGALAAMRDGADA